jgi:hypothetical protein
MRAPVKFAYKWSSPDVVAEHVRKAGFLTKSDWYKNSPGTYQTCRNNGWVDTVVDMCNLDTRHRCKYVSLEVVVAIVQSKGYRTISEWRQGDRGSYAAAKNKGWVAEVSTTLNLDQPRTKWDTVQQIIDIVKVNNFKSKADWIKGHNKSYSRALQLGWMPEIEAACEFTPFYRTWATADDIVAFVKTLHVTSRNQWALADCGSYGAAKRLGVVNHVCDACGIEMNHKALERVKNRPHKIYFTVIRMRGGQCLGYGLSGAMKSRMRKHRRECQKAGASITFIATVGFPDVDTARLAENLLKKSLPRVNTGIRGFRTEATNIGNYKTAIDLVRDVSEYIEQTM